MVKPFSGCSVETNECNSQVEIFLLKNSFGTDYTRVRPLAYFEFCAQMIQINLRLMIQLNVRPSALRGGGGQGRTF